MPPCTDHYSSVDVQTISVWHLWLYLHLTCANPSDAATPDPSSISISATVSGRYLWLCLLSAPPHCHGLNSGGALFIYVLTLSSWFCDQFNQQQQPLTSYLAIRESSQQHDISLKVHDLWHRSAPSLLPRGLVDIQEVENEEIEMHPVVHNLLLSWHRSTARCSKTSPPVF